MNIKYHLMVWFSLVFTVILCVAGWIIYSFVHNLMEDRISEQLINSNRSIVNTIDTAASVAIHSHLRITAQKNTEILEDLHEQSLAGKLSRQQAQKEAESILLSQHIGASGYIYVITGEGLLTVHPHAGLKNVSMSEDQLGKALIAAKNGYLEYEWRNPGEPVGRSKIVFLQYFEPWDWIISVSGYRNEFNSLLEVDDLQRIVEGSQFGKSGRCFILNHAGRILFQSGHHDQPSHYLYPLKSLKTIADHKVDEGTVFLIDDETLSRNGGRMLVSVRLLPKYDWTIVSEVSLDEEMKPLAFLRNIILFVLAGALMLILFLSLFISGMITRPLEQLAAQMSREDRNGLDVRADESALGEVGLLARRFNHYLARLRTSYSKLQSEIDVRIQVEQQLKLFAKVFENALEGITITDDEGSIIVVNQAFTDITGYAPQEVVGQNPRVLKSDRHPPEFYSDMWLSLKEKGSWVGEIWNRRKSGEAYPEILSISSITDEYGVVNHYVAVFHDITDMKLKEEQINYQAYHDALTGLPNRSLANDRLEMAILHAKRWNSKVGLFFLDLDNFKTVNDSLGHAFGDRLLQKAGKRLGRVVGEENTVARLGGDEFLVIAVDIASERQVLNLADRLVECFKEPFHIGDQEVYVTFSIGITLFPDDGEEITVLTKNADAAMYQAKQNGRNAYSLFTPGLIEKASDRMRLEKDLRHALKDDQFSVFFQPKYSPAADVVSGLEALVRWRKPDGSVVSPGEFIPVAEDTGLIIPLGEQVLRQSCRALIYLDSLGFTGLKVAVNLSPVQFMQPDLVERFLWILKENNLPPSRLELEITETTMMTDLQACLAKLNLLVDHGIRVAIDDFGTGYSSLYYLKNLPIDSLKIDRSFIRDITHDSSDAQIVETIILMARNLGIDVVAEGVETAEQLALLTRFRCEQVQGYYYSRPLPLEDLASYLVAQEGRCAAA